MMSLWLLFAKTIYGWHSRMIQAKKPPSTWVYQYSDNHPLLDTYRPGIVAEGISGQLLMIRPNSLTHTAPPLGIPSLLLPDAIGSTLLFETVSSTTQVTNTQFMPISWLQLKTLAHLLEQWSPVSPVQLVLTIYSAHWRTWIAVKSFIPICTCLQDLGSFLSLMAFSATKLHSLFSALGGTRIFVLLLP